MATPKLKGVLKRHEKYLELIGNSSMKEKLYVIIEKKRQSRGRLCAIDAFFLLISKIYANQKRILPNRICLCCCFCASSIPIRSVSIMIGKNIIDAEVQTIQETVRLAL